MLHVLTHSFPTRRSADLAAVRAGHGMRDAVPAGRAVAVGGAQARAGGRRRRPGMSIILQAEGLGKRFGGLRALSEVSFDIRAGEIYGLIGPNGDRKSPRLNSSH